MLGDRPLEGRQRNRLDKHSALTKQESSISALRLSIVIRAALAGAWLIELALSRNARIPSPTISSRAVSFAEVKSSPSGSFGGKKTWWMMYCKLSRVRRGSPGPWAATGDGRRHVMASGEGEEARTMV